MNSELVLNEFNKIIDQNNSTLDEDINELKNCLKHKISLYNHNLENFNSTKEEVLSSFNEKLIEEFSTLKVLVKNKNIPSNIVHILLLDFSRTIKIKGFDDMVPFFNNIEGILLEIDKLLSKIYFNYTMPSNPYNRTKGIVTRVLNSPFFSPHVKYFLKNDFNFYSELNLEFKYNNLGTIIQNVNTERNQSFHRLNILKYYLIYLNRTDVSNRVKNSIIYERSLSKFPYIEEEFINVIKLYITKFQIEKYGFSTNRKAVRLVIEDFFKERTT